MTHMLNNDLPNLEGELFEPALIGEIASYCDYKAHILLGLAKWLAPNRFMEAVKPLLPYGKHEEEDEKKFIHHSFQYITSSCNNSILLEPYCSINTLKFTNPVLIKKLRGKKFLSIRKVSFAHGQKFGYLNLHDIFPNLQSLKCNNTPRTLNEEKMLYYNGPLIPNIANMINLRSLVIMSDNLNNANINYSKLQNICNLDLFCDNLSILQTIGHDNLRDLKIDFISTEYVDLVRWFLQKVPNLSSFYTLTFQERFYGLNPNLKVLYINYYSNYFNLDDYPLLEALRICISDVMPILSSSRLRKLSIHGSYAHNEKTIDLRLLPNLQIVDLSNGLHPKDNYFASKTVTDLTIQYPLNREQFNTILENFPNINKFNFSCELVIPDILAKFRYVNATNLGTITCYTCQK